MKKQRIHIENLRIRLPREMTGNGRRIAGAVGGEIIKSISDALRGKTGELRIDNLSATIQASGGETGLIKRAAKEIAAEVKTRLG